MAQSTLIDQKLEIGSMAEEGQNNMTSTTVTTATSLNNDSGKEEDLEANNNNTKDVTIADAAVAAAAATAKADEEQIILQKPTRQGRWGEIVSTNHADLIFVLCSLTTGLCDGVVYASFGCFISMQTGNTIFLGLGASGIPSNKPFGWLKSLTSILGFFTGSFVFSNLMRLAGNRKRGTLSVSFAVQALFVFIGAAIIQGNAIPHDLNNQPTSGPLFLELIPLALLAFQFGGQITASRGMGFNELPTVVLTSVYFDIASDPGLIDGVTKNVKRNRRFGSVVAIVLGAISAGWLCRSDAEMQSALWISGFIKACIAIAWTVWPVAAAK